MVKISKDARDLILKGGLVVGGIGLAYYAVRSFFNPGPPGGPCTDPASPCGASILPLIQQMQSCSNNDMQLLAQIAKAGNPPTPGQVYAHQQYQACENTAAQEIAALSIKFQPPDYVGALLSSIEEGVLIVSVGIVGAVLLPRLPAFFRNVRGTKLITPAKGGAGASAVSYDLIVQYASAEGLITSAVSAAWRTSVSDTTTYNINDMASFFDSLAASNIISLDIASAEIASLNATMIVDEAVTIAALP